MLLLSYIKYLQRGYLLNQVLYTRLLICAELLSKAVSATVVFSKNVTFLPLPTGGTVVTRSTVGSSTILNQLVLGLIMVMHMKSILEPSLPLRVQGPMSLAGNVGDMSATHRQRVKMLPIFCQRVCWCQHKNYPHHQNFVTGITNTSYLTVYHTLE